MNILLGFILISTWGVLMVGLLSYILNSSKMQALQIALLELNINSLGASPHNMTQQPKELSPFIKNMIQNSAEHPEAQEIQPTDELVGIIFEGSNYPPIFDEDDYDEDNYYE